MDWRTFEWTTEYQMHVPTKRSYPLKEALIALMSLDLITAEWRTILSTGLESIRLVSNFFKSAGIGSVRNSCLICRVSSLILSSLFPLGDLPFFLVDFLTAIWITDTMGAVWDNNGREAVRYSLEFRGYDSTNLVYTTLGSHSRLQICRAGYDKSCLYIWPIISYVHSFYEITKISVIIYWISPLYLVPLDVCRLLGSTEHPTLLSDDSEVFWEEEPAYAHEPI